jgi:hypothetical protein
MDASTYQTIRFAVECNVRLHCSDESIIKSLVDDLMRVFLASINAVHVSESKSRRQFLTFRRSPDIKPPSWAYRKPGIDSRLPTL